MWFSLGSFYQFMVACFLDSLFCSLTHRVSRYAAQAHVGTFINSTRHGDAAAVGLQEVVPRRHERQLSADAAICTQHARQPSVQRLLVVVWSGAGFVIVCQTFVLFGQGTRLVRARACLGRVWDEAVERGCAC
jgi:hypothetical protein